MVEVGVVVLACAVVALVLAGATAAYRRKVAHAADLDGDGVHLRRTSGRDVRTWPWSTITRATAGPVRPVASAVAHQGLHLALADGSSAEFLFPSRSTLRYPPELLASAMGELARYGKGAGSRRGDLAG
jgi:hypothetical protein